MYNNKSTNKRFFLLIPLLFLISLSLILYKFGERWLKHLLIYLSHASWARNLVTNLGIARPVARRFVAGETLDEALIATRSLNANGLLVTLDYLGEQVTDEVIAAECRDEILGLLDKIAEFGLSANVSVKLTQLGLRIREEIALNNLRQILERAKSQNNRIRIDMEESDLVDSTLRVYRTLRDQYGFNNVGVVIQAYLYRSGADVKELIDEGAWVRLCKGAYAESPEVAFPDKADTDANFILLAKSMLSDLARENGVFLAVASHDEQIINEIKEYVHRIRTPKNNFEFQMLYGIRRDLQDQLVKEGYQVRAYVPYGTAWYPYLVRRLAERPANLWFFVSNFLRR